MEPLIVPLEPAPRPEEAAARLAGERCPFFLDSSLRHDRLGRFSFAGCDPYLVMRSTGRQVTLEPAGGPPIVTQDDPLEVLQRLTRWGAPPPAAPVPFTGGAVGYLAYDLGRLIERLPVLAAPCQPSIPDASFGFYDTLIAWDHVLGTAYIISTGLFAGACPPDPARARDRLQWLHALLPRPGSRWAKQRSKSTVAAGPVSNFTAEAYRRAVARARDYIIAGDCYQVNLSQRFQTRWTQSPWALYERLRTINPASFAAYQDFGAFALASSSPERFLKLEQGVLETRPIKGTRPRGSSPAEDAALAAALLTSEKDRAEHIMIVDLERNDLGRVAEVGSVEVVELAALESYATVHHLTSTIRAKVRREVGLADILRATFPGGSITGAPKIRAMEIIEDLEPARRGVYTGAIGYIGAGTLDLNIAIRTIVLKGGMATFQVGGGIVYDSTPEGEYQETLDKGRALAQALTG